MTKTVTPIRKETIQQRLGLPADAFPVAFIAMEYWAFLLNRTFLVFVRDNYLWGIKVKGIVGAPPPPFEKRWNNLEHFLTNKFLRRHPEIATPSDTLVRKSWCNFRINVATIEAIVFDPTPKWGMGTIPHSGKLYIAFEGGKQREFILISDQDGYALVSDLQFVVNSLG